MAILSADRRKITLINKAGQYDQDIFNEHRWHARTALILRRNFQSYYFVHPPIWKVVLRSILQKKRMLPSFASLGAVRSGTSLLSDYIMQHPCVVLPLAKEVGMNHLPVHKLIQAQFPTLQQGEKTKNKFGTAITGYCTPIMPYLAFPYLVSQLSNNIKFIIIMRDPVDRTFAHWRWDQTLLSNAKKDYLWQRYPDFNETVRLEIESIKYDGSGMTPMSGPGGGYIHTSIYLPFLINLQRQYGRESIFIVNANDFFQDPAAVARQLYSFLNLPDYKPVEMPVKNAGPALEMDSSTRKTLQEFFKPHNEKLYEFLGKDMKWQ